MAANNKMVHARVDDAIRSEASAILGEVGLSMSEAFRLFLHRVVATQGFPLELKVPNAQTRAALEEARAMRKSQSARYGSATELFDDLNADH